jgi:DNA-binding protein H-NS
MSVLNKYKQLQEQLEQVKAAHDALEQDPQVQRMMEAGSFLRDLMSEYGLTVQGIVDLLEPGHVVVPAGSVEAPARRARRQRPLKVYTNPHTGETVETRGGNHRTLREWRERWGDAVADWAAEK